MVAIIILLTVIRVVVSNSIATNGIALGNIQEELENIKRQNALLKEQILHRSSMTHIASEAATLGFVSEKKEILLIQPPIALKR
jgi:hypothetical protein